MYVPLLKLPLCTTYGSTRLAFVQDPLCDARHPRHLEPTHAFVQIPAHITPEDVIETIEAYARSCVCRLSSPSAWEAAVSEWAKYTRYSACHHEPDLASGQRGMYIRALFSILDNLYKEEDQTRVATCHLSLPGRPGVNFLFVGRLSASLSLATRCLYPDTKSSWLICRLGVYLNKTSTKQA